MFAVFTPPDGPTWQRILFGAAAVIILVQAYRGWRSGAVRQIVSIVALVLAYAAAFFGRDTVVPLLRPMGLPDRHLSFIGGVLLATVVYSLIMILSAIIFKKTSQQDVGLVRVSYGFFGALIGAAKGFVIVWLIFVVLRLLGFVAEMRVEMAKHPLPKHVRDRLAQNVELDAPGTGVSSLADMKSALDESPVGGLLDRLDPFPNSVHRVVPKMIRVFSDERSTRRLQDFPGMNALMKQPILAELGHDPNIARAVAEQNYVALFRNERMQEALTDPELSAALRKFEFEKALDYALATPEKTPAPPIER
jgi:uncharacterized membrane protein required for colicin V production